ncbi:c-type cytochrome [Methylocystis iwaonis]|uniref:Cytochrome c n=1 Tax=Methylocystis iwaonis TaxID=2885079 RepID=A0ABM8E3S6_9HYPH|nr:c-type cytochrome [Methylocystis iwaonis]BDV32539.1 cytochrome c [Methylocystis iwaonis]
MSKTPTTYIERAARAISVILSFGALPPLATAGEPAPDAALGERLYFEGRKVDGSPLLAKTQSDVPLPGSRAACVTCHRPSGFGTSEGGYFVPPINGATLFSERKLDRGRFLLNRFEQAQPQRYRARLSQPHMRPAYDFDTLGRALRNGVDAAGQELDPIMPRYELSAADVANLQAFLKNLSAKIDPGVTDEELHFATVVSKDAAPQDRAAMLSVIEAYFDWANKNSGGERSREGFSPYHQSELISATRKWRLHVWELDGAPESWPEQLEQKYRAQPVFALVSGLAPVWGPIAEFSDSQKIPALFPNTELPGNRKDSRTFYFTHGLELEAKGLVTLFSRRTGEKKRVRQIVGEGPLAAEPAKVFEQGARAAGVDVETIAAADNIAGGRRPASKGATDAVVLWPGQMDDEKIASLLSVSPAATPLYLPSHKLDFARSKWAQPFADRLFFVDPYEVDVGSHPLSFRVRAWLNTRGVQITNQTLQFQTYYALSLLDAAVGRLKTDFFRDYLVENVEHEAEGDLNPGIFPRLSLGPGQRVASHGVFVVRTSPDGNDAVEPVGDWMIP